MVFSFLNYVKLFLSEKNQKCQKEISKVRILFTHFKVEVGDHESTNDLENLNNECYEYQGGFGSPMQFGLPSQFFEKICDLENSLLVEKNLIKIENLARLYKIGVEFYSGVNSVKESDYLFRLQSLFSNKHLSHFYDEKDRNKHIKSDIKRRTRFNMEIGLAAIEKESISASTVLARFELKFNDALKLIGNDTLSQEKALYNMIKRKKREMELLAECVSFFK